MNKVIVNINGSEYPVVGEKSELHMMKVGKYVDSEMTKAMECNPKLSTSQAAVLTAINITDIFFECCEENEELIKENEELSKKVGVFGDEAKLEMKKLQLKIFSLNDVEKEHKKVIENLEKSLDEKNKEKEDLGTVLINKAEEIKTYKEEIEELKRQLEEADSKVKTAETMCSKFQNDAYRIQLEKIEIENELKFKRASR